MGKSSHQELLDEVASSKAQGNEAIKKHQYTEAAINYTKAIQIESTLPKSLMKTLPQLYSNRSLAYLKLKQYSLALKDAQQAIVLEPTWVKGYFRLGEVQFATENYLEACASYTKASQMLPEQTLIQAAVHSHRELLKQEKFDRQIPWLAAGMGLILGVILVVLDVVIPAKSSFQHPIVQVFVTIFISLAGLFAGYTYRWYIQSSRKAFLEMNTEVSDEATETVNEASDAAEKTNPKSGRSHPRYTKAQANLRYRRGKS